MKKLLGFVAGILLCLQAFAQEEITVSDKLHILPLTSHSFIHISYIPYEGSNVACNGLVYINGNEAVIMDTPTDDSVSNELMDWMAKEYPQVKIKAVIVHHFHGDCLGGLKAFHDRGITSYANMPTLKLAKKDKKTIPQHGFKERMELVVGNEKVILSYHGPAHAPDNIVTYIPAEKVLFGGCMVKELNADKGYISDADVKEWPSTIKKVRNSYPEATIIVPGHGATGGKELLDYTIALFSR
jgi:metallo-beta-lactamase class B